jgi:hypothetical protein
MPDQPFLFFIRTTEIDRFLIKIALSFSLSTFVYEGKGFW